MGLLDFIFGKPQKVENDFFGTMTFVDCEDPSKNYFECRRYFQPSYNIIEIGIDGNLSGPTQIQIDFFKSIELNYNDIVKSISTKIEDEFRNWKSDFKIIDFKKEFDPVYLRIPNCEKEIIIWEIGFETKHEENHMVTMTMHNFDAADILVDG